MIDPAAHASFLERFDAQAATSDDRAALAVQMLAGSFPHYGWVGVYWLVDETLELGPYVGAPTEHCQIPVGRGVCGTAVATGQNQLVADVRQVPNYLACSLETRSEIVVLIRDGEKIVGQIDADGHEVGAFDKSDEALLEAIADRLGIARNG